VTDLRSTSSGSSLVQVRYLHHVSFRVDDLGAALDFYERILGFTKQPRPLAFPGAWLQAGDVQVHLIEVPADASTGIPPTRVNSKANHVAFSVPDLQAFRSYLEREGLAVTGSSSNLPQFFVADPSGNVIEFTELGRV
jgi:glyoxylase I family protein